MSDEMESNNFTEREKKWYLSRGEGNALQYGKKNVAAILSPWGNYHYKRSSEGLEIREKTRKCFYIFPVYRQKPKNTQIKAR